MKDASFEVTSSDFGLGVSEAVMKRTMNSSSWHLLI